MADTKNIANILFPPPLIFLLSLIIGLVLHWRDPVPAVPSAISSIMGIILVAIGFFIGFAASGAFRRNKTPVNPYQETTALVNTGVYRYTRNPLYVTMALWLIGIGLLVNSLWTVLMVIPPVLIVHYGVILREEKYLEQKFGAAYTDYKSKVRRWL